jgi:hypothetical protein
MVHRLPQRALDRFGRQRIAELLAVALRVHVAGIRVLMAGDQIQPRQRMPGQVGGALRVGMEQRRRLDPIFVRRIDLHPSGQVSVVVHLS